MEIWDLRDDRGTEVCCQLELPPETTVAGSRASFPGMGLPGGTEPLGSSRESEGSTQNAPQLRSKDDYPTR